MDISVIVPFYKGNAYMEQLFACIRNNALSARDVDIELILVNDSPKCPVQYQPEWVEGFTLTMLTNPVNMGIQRTRVQGLMQAQGDFVMFLDQDDLLTDNALGSQFRYTAEADVVVANGINQNRDSKRPIYHSLAHQKLVSCPRFYYSVGCQIVSPGQCLIRKDKIPEVWYEMSVRCNGADDYFLWLLMLEEDYRWQINPEVLYTHVDTGENLSADADRMLASSLEVLVLMKKLGKLPEKQERIAKRRFRMRQLYEGKTIFHKALAMALYPDLFLELLVYTSYKKLKA